MMKSPVDGDAFLTPREAAAVLRISLGTLYGLLRSDEVPSTRVGKSYRIPRSEFEEKFGLERGAA